jgi:hypothetical protein
LHFYLLRIFNRIYYKIPLPHVTGWLFPSAESPMVDADSKPFLSLCYYQRIFASSSTVAVRGNIMRKKKVAIT